MQDRSVRYTKLVDSPQLSPGSVCGALMVIEPAEPVKSGSRLRKAWTCQCACGMAKVVLDQSLRTGRTTSCGCVARLTSTRTRHGATSGGRQTKTYQAWRDMLQRCNNPNNPSYKNYGGRGITVIERWKVFDEFLQDMGEAPVGLTIDRIDSDKGYEPGNCEWSNWDSQALHKRTHGTQLITFNGKSQAPSAWAAELCIPLATILGRRRKGWPVSAILSKESYLGRNRNGSKF